VADLDAFTPPSDDSDAGEGRASSSKGRAKHRKNLGNESDEEKKGSFWRELPILIVTALVLTFLIQTFLARVYVIPSQSMELTLHGCTGCTNDRVLVDKLSYRFKDPSPGDVVVFKGPESWAPEFDVAEPSNAFVRGIRQFGSLVGLASPDERDFVKRVIATGGQTVQCCDDRARVLVDGKPLNEPYIHFEEGRGGAQEAFAPVQVPPDHVWVMGDNRNNSSDSRRHVDDASSGTIPLDNVIGKARVIVLPPSRWDGISDYNPQTTALGLGADGSFDGADTRLGAPAWRPALPAALGLLLAWPVWRGASATGRAVLRPSRRWGRR
jgi:signal peptidase I